MHIFKLNLVMTWMLSALRLCQIAVIYNKAYFKLRLPSCCFVYGIALLFGCAKFHSFRLSLKWPTFKSSCQIVNYFQPTSSVSRLLSSQERCPSLQQRVVSGIPSCAEKVHVIFTFSKIIWDLMKKDGQSYVCFKWWQKAPWNAILELRKRRRRKRDVFDKGFLGWR